MRGAEAELGEVVLLPGIHSWLRFSSPSGLVSRWESGNVNTDQTKGNSGR